MCDDKINIGGSSSDPFYRYTMPKLRTVNRNGKTEISNLADIARELERSESFIVSFLKSKLSTHIQQKKDKIILAGIYLSEKLQEEIKVLIDSYVLCPTCGNPETEYKKDSLKCRSCGSLNKIEISNALKRHLL